MTNTLNQEPDIQANKCCQEKCSEKAMYYVFWPGQGKKLMCSVHAQQAERISDVMGFRLHIELIPVEATNE